MKKNSVPNSDIIGYEGTAGNEKRTHYTHFKGLDKPLRKTRDTKYKWIKIGVGKYKLVKIDGR